MIGGIVTETIVLPDRVWINCRETCSTSECAIYVERTAKARAISEGDHVWWQDQHAMWTPACNQIAPEDSAKPGSYDIRLNRIGYSGVPRPTAKAPQTENH